MSTSIVLYSAKLCGDCQLLKQFMDAEGIAYETRDIREQPEHAKELEERTGKQGVPYLIIDGQWKRGYEPGKPFSEAFARSLFAEQPVAKGILLEQAAFSDRGAVKSE